MMKLTRSIAAMTAALQFLFLPVPVIAEEAESVQPYYTVTAAPADQGIP